MLYSIAAIAVGAALGALLRWVFGMQWNALFPLIPLGTLAANLVGGYLIGIAVVCFGGNTTLPPEWRLFVITGFLGGLTTFSTFSVAPVRDHRFPGRPHHFLHLLGRGRRADPGGSPVMGVRRDLDARDRIAVNDYAGYDQHAIAARRLSPRHGNPPDRRRNAMQGFQITFFFTQDRTHKGKGMTAWLLDLAAGLGISGATASASTEGFGRHHHLHSRRFFELADQPLELTMAVSGLEIQQLFECLRMEQIKLFYVVSAVEFGVTGEEDSY
jgi:protein CrcB